MKNVQKILIGLVSLFAFYAPAYASGGIVPATLGGNGGSIAPVGGGCPNESVVGISQIQALDDFQNTIAQLNGSNMALVTSGAVGCGCVPPQLAVDLTPESPNLNAGDAVSFSAQVSGGLPPYNFVWKKNGIVFSPNPGATIHSIASLVSNDQGMYRVEVSDSTPTCPGSNADQEALTVNVPQQAPSTVNLEFTPASPVMVNTAVTLLASVDANASLPLTYVFKRGATVLQTYSNVNSRQQSHALAGSETASAGTFGFSVEVTNSANVGSPEIGVGNLQVIVNPLSVQITPMNPSIIEGSGNVTFNAIVSGGTGPYNYVWRFNGTIIGTNSPTLVLSNPMQANSGTYSVDVSDSGNPVQNGHAQTDLNVTPPNALRIDVLLPENGQVGVDFYPNYTWELYQGNTPVLAPANSQFRIKLTEEANCPAADAPLTTPIIREVHRDLREFRTTAVSLRAQTEYRVCVRLEEIGTGQVLAAYDTNQFSTRLSAIPPVVLRTDPSSSAVSPSGLPNFDLIAEAPESGSFVVLSSYDSQGSLITEYPAAQLNTLGRVTFRMSVSNVELAETLRFKARIQRGAEYGPFPNSTTNFYYDPNEGLEKPVLEFQNSTCDGNLTWNSTGATHSYKLYRRKNKDELSANPSAGQFFNNNESPYEKIADIPASGVAVGMPLYFSDANFNTPTIIEEGISYFLTASDGTRTSRRSNAVNCQDATNWRRDALVNSLNTQVHSVQVNEREDGSTLDFYLLEHLNSVSHASGDNDADKFAYIQLTPTTTDCNGISWDDSKEPTVRRFDSLTRISDSITGLNRAIPIGSATFATGASYCSVICVTDSTMNRSYLQSMSQDFSQHPELCFQPQRIVLTPDFAGIETLEALDNGESLLATWTPLENVSNALEFIDYRVEAVKIASPHATPDFSGSLDASITLRDISEGQATLDGLESGAFYAVRVVAIATGITTGDNRFGEEHHLKKRTVDLAPVIRSAKIDFPLGTMTQGVLTLKVRQQQPTQPITGIGNDPLSVRLSAFSVRGGSAQEVRMNDIERRVLSGMSFVQGMQLPSEESTIVLRLDTSEVLRLSDRDGFRFRVVVENNLGYEGLYEGDAVPGDGLVAGSDSEISASICGSIDTTNGKTNVVILLIATLFAVLWFRRGRLEFAKLLLKRQNKK